MSPKDQEIVTQKQLIARASAAEDFPNTETGKLITEYMHRIIQEHTAKVFSDEYTADHKGYLNSRAYVNIATDFLRMLEVAKARGEPARRKLQEVESAD